MKKLRWQLLIVLLAVVAISILLLGRQPVIQAVVQEPTTGGVYSEGLIGSIGRLNPVLDYYNPVDRDVNRLLYSSLIIHDSLGLPQPDLAESWGISQDGTVYNFTLRDDVFWHDGNPVTTFDVEFTIRMLRDPLIPLPEDQKSFWEEVDVRPLDEKTIQFRIPEPYAPFLDYLTFGVLPEHLVGALSAEALVEAPFNLNPTGSGPYQFDRFLTADGEITGVVLSAYQDYHVQRPFIDQLVVRYYPDAQQALEAYREGEILGISEITDDVLAGALIESELNLYSVRLPQLTMIMFNLEDPTLPFFGDPALRQALLMALNRQRLVNKLMGGQAIVAHGPIFPGTWAYYDGLPVYEYDPNAAVSILRSAGYTIPAEGGDIRFSEEGPFSFELMYTEGVLHAQIAEEIQRDWAEIGVEVSLNPVSNEEFIPEYLDPGDFQAALIDLDLSRTPDPDPYPFWHQSQITGGQNYARWDDRPASEFLEIARVTSDLAERARLYRNFQARFSRELPALPIFYPVYSYGVDQSVRGVRVGPLFDFSQRFANVYDWFLLARPSFEEVVSPTTTP